MPPRKQTKKINNKSKPSNRNTRSVKHNLMTNKKSPIKEPVKPVGRVAELFAGVGGFRIGLAKSGWKTVFSNQWEPSTKIQHASSVYISNFGEKGHDSEDISKLKEVPEKFDLLVGGFPCQDYSVAKTLNSAKGLKGKKGVLWWEILRLVQLHIPRFIFLENVDRLLKSPSSQRGRDFAVMLRTLGDQGYIIEWRVVNAAEYGFSQRRIRVFIVAHNEKSLMNGFKPLDYILKKGILARALPVTPLQKVCTQIEIEKDAEKVSQKFNKIKEGKSPFLNSGVFLDGIAYTLKTEANPGNIEFNNLGDILQSDKDVDESFYIPKSQLPDWKYLKGAKSIDRIHKGSGTKYKYAEGSMAFPDLQNNPSRTILTGEGGTSPSRFKHIIKTKIGYRRLTPVELERLNGFPDDWTRFDSEGNELPDTKRAFFMGNALVVGVVEKVGTELYKRQNS
jgi:DNA (cytosine-5)-methyltransferase 1